MEIMINRRQFGKRLKLAFLTSYENHFLIGISFVLPFIGFAPFALFVDSMKNVIVVNINAHLI